MILVNRNFGNQALSQAIGDMFKPTSDDNMNIEWVNHTNALASGSTLVAALKEFEVSAVGVSGNVQSIRDWFKSLNPTNIFIVTEHFLKVLDKVYSKIWNESFVETGIYDVNNLSTIYNSFVCDTTLGANSTIRNGNTTTVVNFMIFKKFVDRCITAGVLLEEDRLDYRDQISLSDLNKADLSTNIDLDNKLITLTAPNPINVNPDIDATTGMFHNGKKLFLFMTPYLTNESVLKGPTYDLVQFVAWSPTQEPFKNYFVINNTTNNGPDYLTPARRPIAFFKPKTTTSKYGRSLPLASHFVFSLGTENDRDEALLLGEPTPDIIVDHKDRISHIDSFTLKIKFDKLQF